MCVRGKRGGVGKGLPGTVAQATGTGGKRGDARCKFIQKGAPRDHTDNRKQGRVVVVSYVIIHTRFATEDVSEEKSHPVDSGFRGENMLTLKRRHSGGDAKVPDDFGRHFSRETLAKFVSPNGRTEDPDPIVSHRHVGREAAIGEAPQTDAPARGVNYALVIAEFSLNDTRVKVGPTVVSFNSPFGGADDVDVVAVGHNQELRILPLESLEVRVNGKTKEERTKAAPLTGAH